MFFPAENAGACDLARSLAVGFASDAPVNLSYVKQGCCLRLLIEGEKNGLLSVPVQVREIYETAIEAAEPYHLPDADCLKMCTRRVPAVTPHTCDWGALVGLLRSAKSSSDQ